MLKIYTAQYKYRGQGRTDITAKSAEGIWKSFAPTWSMVTKYKNSDQDKEAQKLYTEQYSLIMNKAFELRNKYLMGLVRSDSTLVFVCFCKSGEFCHRVLLAERFATVGANYIGEVV